MCYSLFLLLFKQKAAYEMRISDWSSDVCSSDLEEPVPQSVAQDDDDDRLIDDGGPGAPIGPQQRLDLAALQERGAEHQLGHREEGHPAVEGEAVDRSEERRGGKAWGSTCRSRGSANHSNKK